MGFPTQNFKKKKTADFFGLRLIGPFAQSEERKPRRSRHVGKAPVPLGSARRWAKKK